MSRRVVITGFGLVSPLGNSPEKLWAGLTEKKSAVAEFTQVPADALPFKYGAEAREFTGSSENYGPLEKTLARNIKKNQKSMCREMQMGIAVAQLAMTHAGFAPAKFNVQRIGAVYGSDFMITLPEEFAAGIKKCLDADGKFHFDQWAEKGIPEVEPLWLLKYLPNLPAAHVAIFNDLRGPNNSLTLREVSSAIALGEAFRTVQRGHADAMLGGATGTKVNPMRTMHAALQEDIARGDNPAELSRPFDRDRSGAVLGEGAGALLLEELEFAQARGAKIWGEVVGVGSSTVADKTGKPNLKKAVGQAVKMALADAKLDAKDIGHIHAHGLSTKMADASEAQALAGIFPSFTPVVAAKANFGNLGAGSGLVELIGSLLALESGKLFPTLNYTTPDPECPVNVVRGEDVPAGDSVVNISFTPQGQAGAVIVRRIA